jgi:hypothetical protein
MTNYFIPALLVMTGCTASETSEISAAVEQAADSAITGQAEAALLSTTTEGALSATPEATAAEIAANANLVLQPPGCATATTSGTITTIVFDGCSGSRGLVALAGTLRIAVTGVTASSFMFTATANDFQIASATIDVTATATYRVSGGTSAISVVSTTTGAGPLGHSISQAGDYTAMWNANCATVEGTWASAAETRSGSTAVTLQRCSAACPIGSVSRTRAGGGTLAVEFDGSATATWSLTPSGDTGTVNLACAQEPR